MTRLSPEQIAATAARAGFTGSGLVRAVAVALAESGGDTAAVNVNADRTRSRDRGLWQINDRWHPEVSDAQAFNPATAAAAAYRISKAGADWSPWATWPALAAVHLGRAKLAAAKVTQGNTAPAYFPGIPIIPPSDLLPGVPDSNGTKGPLAGLGLTDPPAGSGESMVTAARKALALAVHAGIWISDSHNWARVAMVAGGTVGALVALKMVADTGAAGSTARAVARTNPVKAAASVVPIGRVAGAAGKAAKAVT